MLSAFSAFAGKLHDLLAQGGMVALLLVCAVVVLWFFLVAVLLSGFAHGVKLKRWLTAILAGTGLIFVLALAEFSMFSFGADLGGSMSFERP
jgi:hypothetical protein